MILTEYGDAALLVSFTDGDAETQWQQGQAIADGLRSDPPAGVLDVAASYASVLVSFDPLRTEHDAVRAAVCAVADHQRAPHRPASYRLPVLFDGPDLGEVARVLDADTGAVVNLVCTTPWTVRFLGSPAGAPMLDGHDRFPTPVPRRADPRTHLPAGSLGLSGQQAVVYPVVSPGGWQLVGRTPTHLFDLDDDPITVLRPGDQFVVVAIGAAEWDAHVGPLRRDPQ